MYGWRARIGILAPCDNSTIEPEFNRLSSQVLGVSVHCSRMHLEAVTEKELIKMEQVAVDVAAPELAHAGVGIIIFGCTSGSFIRGIGWDKMIIERIEKKTGIPTTTTSTAVVAALKRLNIQKVALGTPYGENLTKLCKTYLEAGGFQVVDTIGLDNVNGLRDSSISLAYQLGRNVDSEQAEAVFISCTDFPTLEVIDILETDLGKPVISANLASFWHSLRFLGINSRVFGHGQLLENH